MRTPDPIAMHVIETTWRAGARLRPAWGGALAAWLLFSGRGWLVMAKRA
jgi:hypothetical protein